MPRHLIQRKHRGQALWIALAAVAALGVTGFATLRAAEPPPNLGHALASQQALAAERPDDPQVQNDLGNLLVLAGNSADAEQAYRRALGLAPDLSSARYNLGLLLLQTERYREAQRAFRMVVEAEPQHAWAHYQLGVLHDMAGADGRAIKRYGQAFRLDPQLAFPEINPHVIQNQHVTAAMLLAYRDLPVVAQVPKAYEEPARIVSLMVTESEAGAVLPPPGRPGEAAGLRPTPTYAPGVPGEPAVPPVAEEGRVLREEDLQQGGTVNQIVVPGGVYQPPPRGGTRVPPVRTYTPPGTPTTPEGRQPGTQPPPGRERFVPGVPSTGRLEIELFPAQGDDVTPAG